jgi:hypothetical protein
MRSRKTQFPAISGSVDSVNWSNVSDTIQNDGTTKTLIANPPKGNRCYRSHKP